MKRALKIISSFFALSILSACGEVPPADNTIPAEEDTTHTHDFCKQVADDAFLASPATCAAKARYYYSCECGEHSEETFEYGELGQHKYEIVETKDATHMEKGKETFKCSVCGDTYTEETPVTSQHTFDLQVIDDKYLASPATCTAKARYYYSCECGEHSAETFEHGELSQHKYEVVDTKDATHTEKGEKTLRCSVCGDSYTEEIPMVSEHTFNLQVVDDKYLASPATCAAKARYYYSCECGEHSNDVFEHGDLLPHSYDQGVVTTEPTHTSCGVKTFTCSVCKHTYTEEIPFLADHTFNLQVAEAKYLASPATCMEKAKYYYSCECGEHSSETFEYGELGDHDYDKGVVTKEPTHLEAGVKTFTCNKCGDTFTREIPKTVDHKFDQIIIDDAYLASPATCTEKAKYYYACECGEHSTSTYENGNLLPHTYGEGVVVKEATLGEEGIIEYTCSVCGNIKQEVIPKHVHKYDQKVVSEAYIVSEATCTSKAQYYYSCECGAYSTSTFETGDFAPHTYGEGVVIKAPTVDHEGITKYTCTVCGHEDNRPTPKHVHVYDKQVASSEYLASPANCIERAKYYYSCECGEYSEETFEYYGFGPHSYGQGVITKEATASEKGTIQYTCGLCGDIHTEELSFESQGLEFELDEDSYTVTGPGTCEDKDIVIPSTYNSKPVTKIGYFAFEDCDWVESIVIPNSVTSFATGAFCDCKSLKKVNIPSGVPAIPDDAFDNCSSLASVAIPDSVTTIGSYAFSECTSLTSITLPDTITTIEQQAFYNCELLKSINIPDSLETLDDYVFAYCHALSSPLLPEGLKSIGDGCFEECNGFNNIIIPSTVTSIERSAFEYCKNLTSILLPEGLETLGARAFYECESLESITIPGGLNKLEDYTFEYCYSLKSVVLPESIEIIGDFVFGECTSLVSLDLPTNLAEIGSCAFYYCESLESIYIPARIESLDSDTFDGCKSLSTIVVDEKNEFYDSRSNCNAIIETATNTLIRGGNATFVPEGVKKIGEYSFTDCNGMKSLEIPYGVESIDDCAFMDNTSIESISISSTVKSIGNYVFCCATNLATIKVDEGNPVYDSRNNCNAVIETSSNTLLFGCKNTVIPSTVTSIANNAFDGAEDLESIVIPSGVKSIGHGAFNSCSSLESITIPSTVETIGWGAFKKCVSLKSVNIPYGITSIDSTVFQDCSSLESITIPSTVKTIDYSAFYRCSKLKSLIIQGDVKTIGDRAFGYCYALENITIQGSVEEVGECAFIDCVCLSSIIFKDGLKTIGDNAFDECTSLKYIVIPSSVTSIGNEAFNDCPALKSIFFEGTKSQYESISGRPGDGGNLTIYYYSETQPESGGNYWHYVNNVPTVW